MAHFVDFGKLIARQREHAIASADAVVRRALVVDFGLHDEDGLLLIPVDRLGTLLVPGVFQDGDGRQSQRGKFAPAIEIKEGDACFNVLRRRRTP